MAKHPYPQRWEDDDKKTARRRAVSVIAEVDEPQTIAELAEEAAVSERTVRRVLNRSGQPYTSITTIGGVEYCYKSKTDMVFERAMRIQQESEATGMESVEKALSEAVDEVTHHTED